MSSSAAHSPSGASTTLSRGAACLPCRRRKTRCDGHKPVCGQCIGRSSPADCEYTDGSHMTRSQMLEENIAILEARIRELEHPDETTPSVRLRNPHTAGVQNTAVTPQHRGGDTQALVDAFLRHASQVGFFLNRTRFLNLLTRAQGTRGPVLDALRSIILTWGSAMSASDRLRGQEATYLQDAIQRVSGSVFASNSLNFDQDVILMIQAEVLLATYFFSIGRPLEGRYHCAAAVTLVTSCRLNSVGINASQESSAALTISLADPLDAVEAGERINAFWVAYLLDKIWAVASNFDPAIPQDDVSSMSVDTPWPLTMTAYERGDVPPTIPGSHTIATFLAGGVPDSTVDGASGLALRAMAAALYERANHLVSRLESTAQPGEALLSEFLALDTLITRFMPRIGHGPNNSSLPDGTRDLLVTRTLACAARVELHLKFAEGTSASRQKCLAAAAAAVAALNGVNVEALGYIDPIMAILWFNISQVMLLELRRLQSGGRRNGQWDGIMNSLNGVLAAMSMFAPTCPLMQSKMLQIQQLMAGL
ncbi:hypothetical protein CERSUDRAFT_95807 [Gelatoporia subvermispora B]|uniref:Zn(2)-C6 fungal-type domain-containing protein n=1 Tax=Ceriporiopsis subvermispora (strain B) TaxID=914234 RepID=M2QWK3_CERS8|nr:hypothetical protein CERSUDRAFT_95807 [Gelatoporia subvermispora B]